MLGCLVLLTFLPTLSQGWAPLDDGLNFLRNERYRGLGSDNLRWMWTTRHAGHYIPLSWMTLGADYLVSGMEPRGYHRTNLLLHLANALLFFALALRLLRPAGTGREASTEEVAAVVRFCAAEGVPLVPFGAGSGVCGGVLPDRRTVILDLKRMRRLFDELPSSSADSLSDYIALHYVLQGGLMVGCFLRWFEQK